jgi:hypothetical protein
VIKNDQAIGWRLAKVDDPDLEMIGGVSIPLSAQTIVTRAVRDRVTASGANAADSDYAMLLDQLGGGPAAVTSIPLIVRGKIVAVLYADSVSTDANAMNVDALELLARVASMAVNLVSIQRAAGAPTTAETTQAAEQPATDDAETYTPQVDTSDSVAEEPRAEFTPSMESAEEAAPSFTDAPAPAETFETPEEPAVSHEPVEAAPSFQTGRDQPTGLVAGAASAFGLRAIAAETTEPEVSAPIESAPPPPTAPAEPVYTSQYSAPLGTSRRYGVSEPELPVDVSEDERRLHNDARRFARLLVSEIKLYNEPKVQEGRNKSDLYERLRDDIDRSRQMYDKRVAPPVAARHDYFHQELVNTLAEGDVTKLGMSYPGASVAA